MRWLTSSIRKISGKAGLTAGGSGGLLSGFTLAHQPVVAMVSAVAFAAALSLPKIFESIYKRRPAILKAKGDAQVDKIKAASEAAALITRTQAQVDLLRSGMEPGKVAAAAEMLRQQSINTDLPEARRLNDEALAKLLVPPKIKSQGTEGDSGPQGVVRPIR